MSNQINRIKCRKMATCKLLRREEDNESGEEQSHHKMQMEKEEEEEKKKKKNCHRCESEFKEIRVGDTK